MPFFSIIIPTYNRADIIGKTIESVRTQQFVDWELIIIDDGGADETKKVVDQFNDTKIKYFWKENGERGAARNYGVEKASGEYVFFLDSDDLIYSNHLSHAFEKIGDLNKPEFFHSRYEEVYRDKTTQIDALNQTTIWQTIQKQNKFACQFFLRKDIAVQTPFLEDRNLKIGEDWLVILKIGLKFTLHISNQVTSAVVQHENRSMNLADYEDIICSRDLIITELTNLNQKPFKSIIRNVYFELTSLASLSLALHHKKKLSFILWLELIIRFPFRMFKQRRTLAILKHLFN